MIFILGSDPKLKTIGPTEEHTCPQCGATSFWIMVSITQWVSLFFLPFFPVKREYFELCPKCDHYHEPDKAERDRLLSLARLQAEALDIDMEDEEYYHRFKKMK
jgi:hypothetical protein